MRASGYAPDVGDVVGLSHDGYPLVHFGDGPMEVHHDGLTGDQIKQYEKFGGRRHLAEGGETSDSDAGQAAADTAAEDAASPALNDPAPGEDVGVEAAGPMPSEDTVKQQMADQTADAAALEPLATQGDGQIAVHPDLASAPGETVTPHVEAPEAVPLTPQSRVVQPAEDKALEDYEEADRAPEQEKTEENEGRRQSASQRRMAALPKLSTNTPVSNGPLSYGRATPADQALREWTAQHAPAGSHFAEEQDLMKPLPPPAQIPIDKTEPITKERILSSPGLLDTFAQKAHLTPDAARRLLSEPPGQDHSINGGPALSEAQTANQLHRQAGTDVNGVIDEMGADQAAMSAHPDQQATPRSMQNAITPPSLQPPAFQFPGPSAGYGEAMRKYHAGAQAQGTAAGELGTAESKIAHDNAERYARLQEQQQTDRQNFIDGHQQYMQQYEQALDQLSSTRVDRGKFWKDLGVGGSILTGLGAIAGMFSYMPNARNPALDLVDKNIDRSIEEQKANIGNQQWVANGRKNLVEEMNNKFHDLNTSTETARAIMLQKGLEQLKEQEGLFAGPLEKARLKQAEAVFQQKLEDSKSRASVSAASLYMQQKQFEQLQKNTEVLQSLVGQTGQSGGSVSPMLRGLLRTGSITPGGAKMDVVEGVPELGQNTSLMDADEADKVQKATATFRDQHRMIKKAMADRKNASLGHLPFPGTADRKELDSTPDRLAESIAKGAVSSRNMEHYKDYMGNIFSSADQPKLGFTANDDAIRKLHKELYDDYLTDLQEITHRSDIADQYKIWQKMLE